MTNRDLVARLRKSNFPPTQEAANYIEQQDAEIERLQAEKNELLVFVRGWKPYAEEMVRRGHDKWKQLLDLIEKAEGKQ